jgi:hypothetical protein
METTVRKMFNAFAKGNWHTMNYTTEKASHAWSDFWYLLIKSGFAFEKTDLVEIRKYCAESSYNPPWYGVDEQHYSLAVRCGNLTFAYACEKLWGRIPFIGFGLEYDRCWPTFSNHATQAKSAGRLVLGTEFRWKGETASVTSFKDKEHSLIACAYHPDPQGYTPSKVKKRFKITVEDFKAEMSKRRKDK